MKKISALPFLLPLLLVCLFFWLLNTSLPLPEKSLLKYFLGIGFYLSLAWLLNTIFRLFVCDFLLKEIFKITIPQLLIDLVSILFYFAAILLIIHGVFRESVRALLAASGLMGIIIGVAIQNIINDFFSGIALNFDPNFQIGNSLNLHDISKKGKIREITWRSTRLHSDESGLINIPNSLIATMAISNLSRRKITQMDLKIPLNARIPSSQAIIIFTSAVSAVPGVLRKPRPVVRVSSFDVEGILYKLEYWIEPAKTSDIETRHRILEKILSNLIIAGIPFGSPGQYPLPLSIIPKIDPEILIDNCSLFEILGAKEKSYLAKQMKLKKYPADTAIFEQGDPGDSMFLVAEGLLAVYISPQESKKTIRVSYLSPGDFFGESSLLTGAPRSATIKTKTDTILFEITKETLQYIFSKTPELTEKLSVILVENEMKNKKAASEFLDSKEVKRYSAIQDIYNKMRRFFNL